MESFSNSLEGDKLLSEWSEDLWGGEIGLLWEISDWLESESSGVGCSFICVGLEDVLDC